MPLYKLKPQFAGLIIQTKIFPMNVMLTLDASKAPLSSETLSNYYRYHEFHQFIDVIESLPYKGVEEKKKKKNATEEKIESGTTSADSETAGGLDSQL
jgi:hypothetical protein